MRMWSKGSLGLVHLSVTACLFLSGCAASLRPLAPQLQPIPVRADQLQPIGFKGVLFRIPAGSEIGSHHDGLAKIPKFKLHWQSGISFGSEEFTLGASETLRQHGYKVLGGEQLLFDNNESHKARFQLGAELTGLRYNTFGSLAGNYNEAVVYVDWQLYDALKKRVVLEHPTRGFASLSPKSTPAVFAAFNNALKNLLAFEDFVNFIRIDQPLMAIEANRELIEIRAPMSTDDCPLPDSLEKVLAATVTIRVGSTHGTGFLISPDGYTITAAHVVADVDEALLKFSNGLMLTAPVVRIDNHQDVALLKLPGSGYKYLSLAVDSMPRIGTTIFAVGTPVLESLAMTVTSGIVSGYREFEGAKYLQTDASLNPGNSGGPLLDRQGRVVAVVSWKMLAAGIEGLAFGVPIAEIARSLDLSFGPPRAATNQPAEDW